MKQEKEEVTELQRKAQVFFSKKIAVHIPHKKGYWKRGIIIEVGSDFFMLEERLEGNMPIFFNDIIDIQPFKEKRE